MTQQIYGYGEDALTYWALTTQLESIVAKIREIDDVDRNCKPKDCILFYRPSFGRRSAIGEFDAILATKNRIYPIESKWYRSNEYRRRCIELTETQIRRHQIFELYWEEWKSSDARNWDKFINRCKRKHPNGFEDVGFPKSTDKLALNLQAVLKILCEHCKTPKTQHLCLFFAESPDDPKPTCKPAQFEVICVPHPAAIQRFTLGLFEMNANIPTCAT